ATFPATGGLAQGGGMPAGGVSPFGGVMQAGGVTQAGGVMPAGGDPNMRRLSGGEAFGGAAAPMVGGMPPAAGGFPTTPSGNSPARPQCDALLVQARLRLAEGDWRTASSLVGQAKTMNVPYGAQDDSPTKVEALISQHRDLEQL